MPPAASRRNRVLLLESLTGTEKSLSLACTSIAWLRHIEQLDFDTLALHLLAHPTDVEEASKLGAASKTCAYYNTQAAIAAAELVVLPYAMLVSSSTRKLLGLSLKHSLLLVNEAHNLPEAV